MSSIQTLLLRNGMNHVRSLFYFDWCCKYCIQNKRVREIAPDFQAVEVISTYEARCAARNEQLPVGMD